jgi:alkylhydroperoxidase/carboxymuconolactone decarboxylase family protein YurZ
VLLNIMLTALTRLRGNGQITSSQLLAVIVIAVGVLALIWALNVLSNRWAEAEAERA